MKFLLEYAKFRDIAKNNSGDEEISKLLNLKFKNDVTLLSSVTIERLNKTIELVWHNTKRHPIIKKIENRTSFKSVSEFNNVVEYGLNQVFPKEIYKGIRESGTYALHFNENRFYLIISINFRHLFDDDADIYIVTVIQNTKEEDIIEIYGD